MSGTTTGGTHISLPCAIIGGYAGLALGFVITLVVGLTGVVGIVTLVLLTVGIGTVLAILCANAGGDPFGIATALKIADEDSAPEARTIVETSVAPPAEAAARPAPPPSPPKAAEPAPAPKAAPRASGELSDKAKANVADAAARAKEALGAVTGAEALTDDTAASDKPRTADIAGEDDLQQIKGLGPQAAAKLKEMEITRFGEVAAWSEDDIDRVGDALGGMAGRIRRDDWVGQAKTLAG